ncbi:pyridoxamine 5'-phosphate oxidase family protein [Paenibacillus sp. NFR01]|uniref:pyridoxamine 5'-phosphate oxidase family protein n=1 Tax=Paenibacillus sp. NFR01 TaxID=1566279 RepID=UPI0008D38780|nr:pyridoxamine 5'-phosphate oxidase family protein [Paenibacillus sp. NFR01]SEU19463.1 hypothetical protein SAMN03159358_3886 [Paenibacillus sp. NFR01]
MNHPFQEIITSEEEIRALLGYPSELVQKKVIGHLDEHCRNFIGLSPLFFLATSDAAGFCDVSPRGDAPGSVLVVDDHHLVIPERQGNRRIDSLRNILENPQVGMVFVIPGLKETLRINGRAFIIRDEDILARMEAKEKRPLLGIGVQVEECFIHCAKAFMRSHLWEPSSWMATEELPSVPAILAAHVKSEKFTEEAIRASQQESYTKRLY